MLQTGKPPAIGKKISVLRVLSPFLRTLYADRAELLLLAMKAVEIILEGG